VYQHEERKPGSPQMNEVLFPHNDIG
jgi:hypothetical protein